MSCGSSLCIQFIGEMIVDDEFKKKKRVGIMRLSEKLVVATLQLIAEVLV